MKNCTDTALEISNTITNEIAPKYKFEDKDESYQFKVTIFPLISNTMYAREKELLENERIDTIIGLSKVLDSDTVKKVMKELGYNITMKK